MRLHEDELAQAVARVEEALAGVENLPPLASAALSEAVSALVDLYGEGLARVVERASEDAPALLDRLADDELVSHLLLVHDLHPHRSADELEILETDGCGTAEPPTEPGAFIPLEAVGSLGSRA